MPFTTVVYHLLSFTRINTAAYAFGLLYIVQAGLFVYVGIVKDSLSFRLRPDKYGLTGAALLLYAMVIYPILGYFLGHTYPRSPTFGLPCPTTIFTFGLLLWAEKRLPVMLLVIPFLWSLIGFTAALSLGMAEDIGLLVAALLAAALILMKYRISVRDVNEHTG